MQDEGSTSQIKMIICGVMFKSKHSIVNQRSVPIYNCHLGTIQSLHCLVQTSIVTVSLYIKIIYGWNTVYTTIFNLYIKKFSTLEVPGVLDLPLYLVISLLMSSHNKGAPHTVESFPVD